ncbi:hypothetical protein PHYNN_38 [Pantoea phage Phynn]|nr:hypothetical protein PHYNN_38 [Pantoea phage Phynn]
MNEVGHDGLGNFYGYNLVKGGTEEKIPFVDIQQKTDTIPSSQIEGSQPFGSGVLSIGSKEEAKSYLGIPSEKADYDINKISDSDLKSLREKLKKITPQRFWSYRARMGSTNGNAKAFRIADTNLILTMTTTSADSVKFELTANDTSLPSSYLVRRFTVYGLASLEGANTGGVAYKFTKTPWVLDDYDYADGRSQSTINIVDATNQQFYVVSLQMNIDAVGRTLYVEVNKTGNEGYIDVQ